MGRLEQTDDRLSIEATPLTLSFQWDGRRWSHEVAIHGKVVASSLEMDPDRDDPSKIVSPSFQQLSSRRADGEDQALLVGQWGSHHSSAVFRVFDREDDGVTVEVDLAARSRSPLSFLASTYVVDLTSSQLEDASPQAIAWRLPADLSGWLRFESDDPGRVAMAEAGRRATSVQASAAVDPGVSTHRLKYRWRWGRSGISS